MSSPEDYLVDQLLAGHSHAPIARKVTESITLHPLVVAHAQLLARGIQTQKYVRRAFIAGAVVVTAGSIFWRLRGDAVLTVVGGSLSRGWVQFKSWLLSKASTELNPGVRNLIMANLALDPLKMPERHSHPLAAATRSSANFAIDHTISLLGYSVYSVSKSARDHLNSGNRFFYFQKDLALKYDNSPVKPDSIIKMVDVDYYADMSYWLSYCRPVLAYTFVPTRVAGKVPDGSFTIEKNRVEMTLSGGATYSHELWDYSADTIATWCWSGMIVSHVEQWKMPEDPERRVVAIIPCRKVPWWLCWTISWDTLRRREFEVKGYNVLRHIDHDGSMISVGRPGSHASAEVSEEVLESAKIREGEAKHPNISDVERLLRTLDGKNDRSCSIAAPLVFAYLKDSGLLPKPVTGAGFVPTSVPVYQNIGPLLTEDGSETGTTLTYPLVAEEAVTPARSYNNDAQTVAGRIVGVRNTKVVPGFYKGYAQEFVSLLVPAELVGTGSPLSIDEITEKQDRPSQRNRSAAEAAWGMLLSPFVVKPFQKAEFYGGINDPRNISQVPTGHTLRYSGFTYAMKPLLSQNSWYLPGLTPLEISLRVREICQGTTSVIGTDFSRMDGRISEWVHENIAKPSKRRFFNRQFHPELEVLMRNECNAMAVTKFGIAYTPGFSRLSGSPVTTPDNTLIPAFMCYAALRRTQVPKEEAWRALQKTGAYGDDGIFGVSNPGDLERVASDLGMSLKCEVVPKGGNVPLLSRLFRDPWSGSGPVSSICDLSRALPKLHMSLAPDTVPLAVKRFNRASGYYATDSETPLVGAWCRAVLTLCEDVDVAPYEELVRQDRPYDHGDNGSWPQDPADENGWAYAAAAEVFGVDVSHIRVIEDELDSARSFDDFPQPRLHLKRSVKVPAVLDTERHLPIPPGGPDKLFSDPLLRKHGQEEQEECARTSESDTASQSRLRTRQSGQAAADRDSPPQYGGGPASSSGRRGRKRRNGIRSGGHEEDSHSDSRIGELRPVNLARQDGRELRQSPSPQREDSGSVDVPHDTGRPSRPLVPDRRGGSNHAPKRRGAGRRAAGDGNGTNLVRPDPNHPVESAQQEPPRRVGQRDGLREPVRGQHLRNSVPGVGVKSRPSRRGPPTDFVDRVRSTPGLTDALRSGGVYPADLFFAEVL